MVIELAPLIRTAKRLQQATGYLELGMTQHALDCLETVEEFGPLSAEIALLRSRALYMQHRYHDAALMLATADHSASSETSKAAWLTLSLCYQMAGNVFQAVDALAQARGAHGQLDGMESGC